MPDTDLIPPSKGGADTPIHPENRRELPPSKQYPFLFTGNASEYFRIWIVNIFLSIITLGIYSAWAKVRKLRYLYGNTNLDGAAFEYTADPIKILKGRVIAVVALALFGSSQAIPVLYIILAILIFLAVPWLVVKSRMFNLANTRHRNVRFNFSSTYGKSANVFILGPILSYVTLGLGYPWYVARKSKFLIDNTRYGTTPMRLNTQTGQFYPIFIILFLGSFGVLIVVGILAAILIGGSIFIGGAKAAAASNIGLLSILPIIVIGLIYILFLVGARSYMQSAIGNLIWNNASLGEHRFQSTLKFVDLLRINFVNTLAIVFSFGLLIPWATVRSLRYRLQNTSLVAHGSLDDIAAAEEQKSNAVGEEIGDFFNVDVGL
jgi:uncharacterized membrane protein YjgN (DUF898 family)